MVKKIVGVVLIIVAAGAWFYLDQLNKQELQEAAEARKALEQARAQAQARAAANSAASAVANPAASAVASPQ